MCSSPNVRNSQSFDGPSSNFWIGLFLLSMIVFSANIGLDTCLVRRLVGASAGVANLMVLSQKFVS
ncbi:hypothetical protein [Xylella fastidiosa]|uniref:hypothetical protein n=1 Tax=Xylella fastidiosa TaxID=2371 RepID=UPI001EEC0FE5|nr:hypothetical protein [Xylella fastidiosa]